VLLSARNYPQLRPNKLHPWFVGPFKIKRVVSPATLELDLPKRYKMHAVVNIDSVKPYTDPAAIAGRVTPPPPPLVDEQGHPVFTIDRIMAKRRYRNQVQYLIRWRGYGEEADSWEPEREIKDCTEIVARFNATAPAAARAKRGQPKPAQAAAPPTQQSRRHTRAIPAPTPTDAPPLRRSARRVGGGG
jgi:hypothetical protein